MCVFVRQSIVFTTRMYEWMFICAPHDNGLPNWKSTSQTPAKENNLRKITHNYVKCEHFSSSGRNSRLKWQKKKKQNCESDSCGWNTICILINIRAASIYFALCHRHTYRTSHILYCICHYSISYTKYHICIPNTKTYEHIVKKAQMNRADAVCVCARIHPHWEPTSKFSILSMI